MSGLSRSPPRPRTPSHDGHPICFNSIDRLEFARDLFEVPEVSPIRPMNVDGGDLEFTSGLLEDLSFQDRAAEQANASGCSLDHARFELEPSQTPIPLPSIVPSARLSPSRAQRRASLFPRTRNRSTFGPRSEVQVENGSFSRPQQQIEADTCHPIRLKCQRCISRDLQCDYNWPESKHKACTTCSQRSVKCVIEELESILRLRSILLHRGITLLKIVVHSRQQTLKEKDDQGILVLQQLNAFYALNRLLPIELLETAHTQEEHPFLPGEAK